MSPSSASTKTFHYFMLLAQSEPDPSDYILQGQLQTTYSGFYVWSGPTYQCGNGTTTTYFGSGSETETTGVTVRFSSSSCGHFLDILNRFGASYPCDSSVKVGEVEYNLSSAGGSATISNAVRQCPAGTGCYPTPLGQRYQSSKNLSSLSVGYDRLPPPPPPPLEPPPTVPLGNSCNRSYVGSSVNHASGDLYDSVTLFTMKGSGPPAALTLYYNSLDNASLALGPGWTHAYATRIEQDAAGFILLAEEDGHRILFWETTAGSGTFLPEVRFNRQGVSIQKAVDGTYRMTRRDGTTDDFDAQGRLREKRDRNGNAITLSYTGSDLTQIADSYGRVVSISYDASHRIAYATDPAGRSWIFVYDGGGHLASITDAQGAVRSYTYDGSGRMAAKTDPAGNLTSYSYDASGKLASATDPTGTPALVSYSPGTSQASVTGRNGGVTATTYDANLDVPTQVTAPDGSVTTYTYDGYGNVLTATDAAGRTTTYAYDTFGNRTSVTDPLAHVNGYSYNGFGQVTSATDPEGRTTSYVYDANGNLLSVTDPAGAVTQYGYDAKGSVTSVTRPGGGTTAFAYDTYGNLSTATDPAGLVTTFSSDVLGNLLSRTDPNGAVTAYAYDNLSWLTRVTDPLGNATAFAYDGNGNRTSATDPLGRVTLWTYSERNRPLTMTDPLGHVTTYAYTFGGCSSCGTGGDLVSSATDGNGRTTSYEYDLAGRLTKVADPLGNETRYAYDALGNRTSQTDANGRVTYLRTTPCRG